MHVYKYAKHTKSSSDMSMTGTYLLSLTGDFNDVLLSSSLVELDDFEVDMMW